MQADQQRTCPTPQDGTMRWFAHRISLSRCQDQQRTCFHKCYSCEWNNSYQAQKAINARAKRRTRPKPDLKLVSAQVPQVESLPELPPLTAQFVLSTTE